MNWQPHLLKIYQDSVIFLTSNKWWQISSKNPMKMDITSVNYCRFCWNFEVIGLELATLLVWNDQITFSFWVKIGCREIWTHSFTKHQQVDQALCIMPFCHSAIFQRGSQSNWFIEYAKIMRFLLLRGYVFGFIMSNKNISTFWLINILRLRIPQSTLFKNWIQIWIRFVRCGS